MSGSPTALRRYLEIARQPANSAFHTSQVSISFGETIDADVLRAAWEVVASAHAALRSTFAADGSLTPGESASFDWKSLDWQNEPPADLGAEWQALVDSDAAAPIASDSAPACRITLIRLPNGGGHALWSFHAALLDSDSISIVLHEWLHAYDSLRTGAEAPQFEDAPASGETDDESWPSDFEGLVAPRPLIILPLPESPGSSAIRHSISHTFERPERAAFAAAARSLNADLRSLFGAAWAFVVARATTSDDALLLEPSRPSSAVGRSESVVVRRHRVATQKTSGDLVSDFAANVFTPPADLAVVAQKLNLPPAAIEPATSFIYRELTLNDRLRLEMPRWMAADVQLMQKTPGAITLRATATDRPEIALDYDPARISSAAAHVLFDLFKKTLVAFAEDPKLALPEFAVPAAAAVVDGPEAPASFRSLVPQCLHELFADIAAESPDAVAVEMAEEKITFSQLNASANQLSRHLRKRNVAPGSRVGIAMSRSPKWVVAILGALKAGASIVPLSLSTKEKAGEIRAWIVDALAEGEERDLPVIQMQSEGGEIGSEKSRGAQNETTPASEALALATDKKVLTFSHESLAATLQSTAALLGLTPADRVLQFAPTDSFAAVEEALATLLTGATLVLRGENRWATRTAFQEFVQESSISALSVPTPFWSQWTHYLSELSIPAPVTLRIAATTGALQSPNVSAAWRAVAGTSRLLHRTTRSGSPGLAYEPAEAEDTFATACLGQPIPGAIARVVDDHKLGLPAGFVGQVETSSQAKPKDFSILGREAFLSPEGSFYDRTRLQILVNGASPDLLSEAIYLAATSHPEVVDAYVDQRLIAARNEWCLWIVPRDSQRGEPHDFREWLTGRLPSAPRRIRALPRLPLDESGEIDVAALGELLPDDVVAPPSKQGNEAEERLRKIISRILGGRRIELDEILSDGRTKPQIAKLLLEAVSREEPRVELSDFSTGFSVRSILRNVRGRKSGADSKWTPLQPLRASGKQPPLIFIHDFDGASKIYAPLVAQLGAEQPCYAITARGLSDPASCHTTVSEMANAYIEALRIFDTSGPYRLVGYGFGGLVAFEMARQLASGNSEVPLLVLLAAEPPAVNSPLGFLSGGWKRSLPALFGKKPAEEPNSRRRSQDSPTLRANQEAARKYSATAAPLLAHVFAPTQDFPAYRSVQNGWSACCEDVRIYQVPCSGPEMMDEPAVESLAEAISKLAKAESLDSELEE
jgi:thioesterase domain-containing protein/acyl-CoA synthetase (AMP-forming)/AMP-acid ligase II